MYLIDMSSLSILFQAKSRVLHEDSKPLVPIDKDRSLTQEEIKQVWFSHDIFNEDIGKGDIDKDYSDDEMQIDVHQQKLSLPKSNKAKEVLNSHSLGSQTTQNRQMIKT